MRTAHVDRDANSKKRTPGRKTKPRLAGRRQRGQPFKIRTNAQHTCKPTRDSTDSWESVIVVKRKRSASWIKMHQELDQSAKERVSRTRRRASRARGTNEGWLQRHCGIKSLDVNSASSRVFDLRARVWPSESAPITFTSYLHQIAPTACAPLADGVAPRFPAW